MSVSDRDTIQTRNFTKKLSQKVRECQCQTEKTIQNKETISEREYWRRKLVRVHNPFHTLFHFTRKFDDPRRQDVTVKLRSQRTKDFRNSFIETRACPRTPILQDPFQWHKDFDDLLPQGIVSFKGCSPQGIIHFPKVSFKGCSPVIPKESRLDVRTCDRLCVHRVSVNKKLPIESSMTGSS